MTHSERTKALVIGPGYAGIRFINAFLSIGAAELPEGLEIAYVGRRPTRTDIPYFESVAAALAQWQPSLVVVSVTDGAHAQVLAQLDGYRGFVVCEKPLVNAGDDLAAITHQLRQTSGFCLDLVERYSEASEFLKKYVADHRLTLIRANFVWGKDRTHDRRPTCGVPSEIIHALDLVQWIAAPEEKLILRGAIGTTSDFSVSGDAVLDSVAITANLEHSLVTGYSSFVNIERQRTVDFVFGSPERELVYARLIFDTPNWDIDHLRIWTRQPSEDRVLAEFTTAFPGASPALSTIQKLRRLVLDAVCFVAHGTEPSRPFAGLAESIALQTLLNQIECSAQTIGPAKYILGSTRPIFEDEGNLERLG